MRFFRWDESAGTLQPVWNSGVNTAFNFVWAKIQHPGTYVPIGLPRDRLLQESLRALAYERKLIDSNDPDVAHGSRCGTSSPFFSWTQKP